MNQIACLQSRSQIGYKDQRRLNELGDKLRKRFAVFLKMRAQTEEDMNPFADKDRTPSVLFCYILWCIGELPAKEQTTLQELSPQLRRDYDQNGEWQHIVAAVMGLNDDWRKHIQRLWERNSEIARISGVPLTPRQFAEQVIERNFTK